jgi:hypothetical protein
MAFPPRSAISKTRFGLVAVLALALAACGGGDPALPSSSHVAPAAAPLRAPVAAPVPARGVHMAMNFHANSAAAMRNVNAGSNTYFDNLKSMNAEWLGVSVAMFVDSVSDPTVRARYRVAGHDNEIATWDDADLAAFLQRARDRGIKVYLTLALENPLGDTLITPADARCKTASAPIPRYIMGRPFFARDAATDCINEADYWWNPAHPQHAARKAIFWQSYTALAAKYAAMAQQAGVQLYSVGTETDWLFRARAGGGTTTHFASELQALMTAVRAVYSGRVTYDQHIKVHTQPQFSAGGEWAPYLAADLGLDVIGLSTYIDSWPTRPTEVLSVAQLEQSFWSPVFDVLARLQAQNPGKPVFFTEVGVVDDLGAPADQASNIGAVVTGRDGSGNTAGMRQQANLYTALFNVNAARGYPVAGMFFWSMYMVEGADFGGGFCNLVTHQILCSPPARQALTAGYAAWREADAQRVFNWAEASFPALFDKASGQAGAAGGYTYRYYPQSSTFLATREGHVYVHNGRNWNVQDFGPVANFIDAAAGAGF